MRNGKPDARPKETAVFPVLLDRIGTRLLSPEIKMPSHYSVLVFNINVGK